MEKFTVQFLIPATDYDAACELMNKLCDTVNELVDTEETPYSAYVLDDEGHAVY